MSKLYIPENVWLVCSEGTSTQQMLVTSQSKVKIDGGYLMATTADRVKTDFGCKKEALADAIGVAICAMVIAACVVGTGGLGACAIIGLAGAAGAVGGGILGRVMPCGCARCMGPWQNFSPSVIVSGYNALLDDSFSICSKGGTIKIMFSKEAAEAYAALVASKSNVEIANIAILAFVTPFVIKGAGNAILGFKSGFSAALGVSKFSALAFVGETAVVGGTGLAIDRGVDFLKEDIIYEGLDVRKYTDGEIEKEASLILNENHPQPNDSQDDLYKMKDEIEKIESIDSRKASVTDYEKMTYKHKGYLSAVNGYIEETEWDVVEDKTDWNHKIKGTRNLEVLQETDNLTQSSGTYYMEQEYTLETGKDYNMGMGLATDIKNTIKDSVPFASKEGTKSFFIGVLFDAYRGINNKLLENSILNYKEVISSEAEAIEKLKVKTK